MREDTRVSRSTLAVWTLTLIALEVQHLKWIVWTYWDCRRHGVKHHECGCIRRWLLLL